MSSKIRSLDRATAAALGREAVAITRAGRYTLPGGREVAIGDAVAASVRDTVSYPPERPIAAPPPRGLATRITVENDTTLAVARRLHAGGARVAALNFASARHPGGGFLSGARAQEESLCRASALYECLHRDEMYVRHATLRDPLYLTWVIHSPDVPVFRDDGGALLEAPYPVSFLTSPAPNGGEILERDASRKPEITRALALRIARVLAVAALHRHDTLVLGAWGCGAFGNDARDVAPLFRDALAGSFRGAFREIVFAVVDEWDDRRNIGPFERAFASG